MDAHTYCAENGLCYRFESSSFYVYDKVTQGQGDTLEAALKVYLGDLVDRRFTISQPLVKYVKEPTADAAIAKAFTDGTPMPVKVAPVEEPIDLPVDEKPVDEGLKP